MIVIADARLRRVLRIVLPFLVFPALAAAGMLAFGGRHYALFSLAAALCAVFLFFTGFERRATGSRRLVLAAVFTALAVVGRFIPFLKPVAALVILAGVYLGGETGFLVGALTALLSDFYFGMGPWTPFQMFAWGLIGLFAGFLAAPLSRRVWLLLYGTVAGVCYSLMTDVFTVMWYDTGFTLSLYRAVLITALPFTLLYALSNFLFLLWFGGPIGAKLRRIRLKYGL